MKIDNFGKEEAKKYSIKGLKTLNGRDGLVIEASLYYENKKISDVFDQGMGGMLEIEFSHYHPTHKTRKEYLEGAKKQFDKFLEDYPEQPVDMLYEGMEELYPTGYEKLDDEGFVNELIERQLQKQDLQKSLRKEILYSPKDSKGLRVCKYGKDKITDKHLAHFKKSTPHIKGSILNELPIEEALEIYINSAKEAKKEELKASKASKKEG